MDVYLVLNIVVYTVMLGAFSFVFRSIMSRSLWLKIPVGLAALILPIILQIVVLQISHLYTWACKNEDGIFGKMVCAISTAYEQDAPYFRFLPTDEAMIAHLQKHRADFERLVHLFQDDESPPDRWGHFWLETPEAKEIMERIGVSWVHGDPYTIERQAYASPPVAIKRTLDTSSRFSLEFDISSPT